MQSSFSDPSENGSEGFRGLGSSCSPCYHPSPLLNLIPELALDCIVLISRNKNSLFRKVLPYVHMAPSPATFCSFSQCYQQSLCVITNNPWLGPQHLAIGVWAIHMSPYLLGFWKGWCKLRSLMSTFRTRENLRCAAARSSNIYLAFVVTFWSYIFQV